MAGDKLSREERRFLALLGMPALGLSLASTMVATYLPVFIERLTGLVVNGVLIGVALIVFFVAYFVYYSPYYALFPDLVPDRMHGRSMGFQGAFRSVGLLLALVGGSLLLAVWPPLPFLVAAAVLAGATLAFLVMGYGRLVRHESVPGDRWRDFGKQLERELGMTYKTA